MKPLNGLLSLVWDEVWSLTARSQHAPHDEAGAQRAEQRKFQQSKLKSPRACAPALRVRMSQKLGTTKASLSVWWRLRGTVALLLSMFKHCLDPKVRKPMPPISEPVVIASGSDYGNGWSFHQARRDMGQADPEKPNFAL